MKFEHENRHMIDILFVLALFGVFAVSSILLVLIGANVYQNTVTTMDQNYSVRTSFAYITEKIHSLDLQESVEIGVLDEEPALILTESIDGVPYNTYLYEKEGYLKELFSTADADLSSDAGQNILECSDFTLSKISDQLYQVSITSVAGETFQLAVSVRSNQNVYLID